MCLLFCLLNEKCCLKEDVVLLLYTIYAKKQVSRCVLLFLYYVS